jgi:predicted nuclease with TOPRIM domain
MNSEIDINILVKTFSDRMMNLYKDNAILEAKYQSLLQDYVELQETKNELQTEINKINREP